ncbi:DegT/DnrJ/EryC1/StrS family aminotransferase [Nocardia sp. NBC_01388]|uniref:DegT/DnrJ/EryC1/StrS family aminotransferase n=1 Tax=Nocardia sp. NBC_01388 TaxID=2903596 RepID=UPI003246E173
MIIPPSIANPGPARSRPDTDRVMRLGSAQTGDRERAAIEAVLSHQVFYRYHGSEVTEFEDAFAADVLAGQRALAVNSGSSALQVAFAALDEEPGFEVLVPVLGFASAATAVAAAGGVPRFVAVDASLGIDVVAARAAITDRTRAVLAVHMMGAACDLAAVGELASAADLHVVEDVAQACGGTFAGRPLGTHGTAAAFSFQHFKLLSTGEGGMVSSPNDAVMDRAQCLHDAASPWVDPDAFARVPRLRVAPSNLRMSELEGALGRTQLARLPEWIDRLRVMKRFLLEHIERVAGLTLRPIPDPSGDIGTTLVFRAPDPGSAAQIVSGLRTEGVNAGNLLGPVGMNRHFAGDWGPLLTQCGLSPAPPDLVVEAREELASTVVIALDLRWDERDLSETLTAFERVLPIGSA